MNVFSYRASSALSAHRLMTRPSLHTIWSKASRIFPSGGFSSEEQTQAGQMGELTHLKYELKLVNTVCVGQQQDNNKYLDMWQSCGC